MFRNFFFVEGGKWGGKKVEGKGLIVRGIICAILPVLGNIGIVILLRVR